MTLNIISKQPSYYSLIKILLFPLLMIQHYTFNGFGETTSQKYADEPNLLKKTSALLNIKYYTRFWDSALFGPTKTKH